MTVTPSPPGWFPDPGRGHQFRWWDGGAWTDQVADDGVVSADPLRPPPPATGGDGLRAEQLAFVFRGPGIPPWRVLDAGGGPAGWVQAPTGFHVGPRTLRLLDPVGQPVLDVTQSGGLSVGGYRGLAPNGVEIGVYALQGVTSMQTVNLEITIGGAPWAHLRATLHDLIDAEAQVVAADGATVATLSSGAGNGHQWFSLRRTTPAPPPLDLLLLGLPLVLHTEYSERSAFVTSFRDVEQLARRGSGRGPWPGL